MHTKILLINLSALSFYLSVRQTPLGFSDDIPPRPKNESSKIGQISFLIVPSFHLQTEEMLLDSKRPENFCHNVASCSHIRVP